MWGRGPSPEPTGWPAARCGSLRLYAARCCSLRLATAWPNRPRPGGGLSAAVAHLAPSGPAEHSALRAVEAGRAGPGLEDMAPGVILAALARGYASVRRPGHT